MGDAVTQDKPGEQWCSGVEHLGPSASELRRLARQLAPCAELDGVLRACTQAEVYDALFQDPILLQFPSPVSYRRKLCKFVVDVKKLMAESEHDGLVEECFEAVSAASPRSLFDGHLVLPCGSAAPLVLRVSRGTGGELETGGRVWPAARVLSELGSEGKLPWQGEGPCKVLELGAGTGIAGLSLLRLGAASEVILTDGYPAVVENLEYNINATAAAGKQVLPARASVLQWENPWTPGDHDVVLATDVCYHPPSFPALAAALDALLPCTHGAILVNEVRSEETWNGLARELQRAGLRVVEHRVETQVEGCFGMLVVSKPV
mmetsp:Transcript_10064/g.22600  ORF Transcript_10064/g.22600 Transcript_10064/m.22600 type:complete len:320 (-) Transcript_10064:54-1013(-)